MSKESASATLSHSKMCSPDDLETSLFLNENVSYRKISPAKIQLICHTSAKDAYLAWESIPKRPQEHASCLHLKNCMFCSPIYLTKENHSAEINSSTYYYFDSFEYVQYLNSCENPSLIIPILLVQQPDPDIIERRAWSELAKLIFSRILDPQVGAACLLSKINEMPTEILHLLFGTSDLSVSDFRELHGLSQNQYDNQLKKWREYQKSNQKSDVKVSFASILGQINAKN
ncbi:MAG: hypothetical protein KGO49_09450 [Gammaproteobacteria bacterium]|nr:hypothetical protein [Gammaproteobacteria bacterium]